MLVEVKICGLTRPEDAAGAARAGASYLGVVFAESPRQVNVSLASAIVDAAGDVPVLGVFGSRPVTEILRICASAGLSGAQLQTPQVTAVARRLRQAGLIVWRVVRMASEDDLGWMAVVREESSAVLVEATSPHAWGGTGVPLPLYLARQARAHLPGHRMVLAGGLTPDTVGDAIAAVQPDIVDVSSGVERGPGLKDPQRITRFMEAVVGHHTSP